MQKQNKQIKEYLNLIRCSWSSIKAISCILIFRSNLIKLTTRLFYVINAVWAWFKCKFSPVSSSTLYQLILDFRFQNRKETPLEIMLNLTEAAESNSSLFEMDEDEEHSKMTILILFIFYSLIFVIGITGNLLVVYVVVRKKSMRSVTNLFIMNLALSDILICLLAVPFTPISVLDHWVLGKL